MTISVEQSDEVRSNQAARIGRIFGIPDAGIKIERDGVRMDYFRPDKVLLKVELVEIIDAAEAEAILNGVPLEAAD